jgi:hypothetical protein
MNKPELSDDCHRAIFNVEKQELQDSSMDYTLLTTCRLMIRQFCHEEDQSQALVCLKVNVYNMFLVIKCTGCIQNQKRMGCYTIS